MSFLNMFLKILYDVCSRNDNKNIGPPVKSGRKAREGTGTLALIGVASLN
jgi:hypothetical protein